MSDLIAAGGEVNELGGEAEVDGTTPNSGKALAATLGSIEKTEPEVTSPVAPHRDSFKVLHDTTSTTDYCT